MSVKPWEFISSKLLNKFRIFNVRSDVRLSPRTGQERDLFVIECTNWCNVIAITPDQKIVMVEQYRPGSDTVELEIPGGMIDHEDVSPVAAGVRELLEETGYAGRDARLLGEIFPNPAIMNNTCYTVIVEDCHYVQPVQFDAGEDLVTRLVPIEDIPKLVAENRIGHCLVVVALYYFDLWKRGLKTAPKS